MCLIDVYLFILCVYLYISRYPRFYVSTLRLSPRSSSLFCSLQVAKLEDKLEQFKFGLPTILLNSEKSIYESTKQEIDQVNKTSTVRLHEHHLKMIFSLVLKLNQNWKVP